LLILWSLSGLIRCGLFFVRNESTGQSTYLAAIRQEQLLRQGDTTVDDFFDLLSVV
jgi:hypothetical protein